jgi:hypothetical protein
MISKSFKETELGQSEYDAKFQQQLFDYKSSKNCQAVLPHLKHHRISLTYLQSQRSRLILARMPYVPEAGNWLS